MNNAGIIPSILEQAHMKDAAEFMNTIAGLMREVEIQQVLSRFGRLHGDDVETKSHAKDFVTTADKEAERILTERLPQFLPGSLVIGEEGAAKNKAILDYLQRDQLVWILDPVDGTAEFVDGTPKFCMLAALAYKGEVLMGWILLPDTGRQADTVAQSVLMGVKGQGAYLNHFGAPERQILIPKPGVPQEFTAILARKDPAGRNITLPTEQLPLHCRSTRCIGREFADMILTGAPQAISYDRCHITPWDFAAPHVILLEAGGCWGQFDGQHYRPSADNDIRFIAAANEDAFDRARSEIYPDWNQSMRPQGVHLPRSGRRRSP